MHTIATIPEDMHASSLQLYGGVMSDVHAPEHLLQMSLSPYFSDSKNPPNTQEKAFSTAPPEPDDRNVINGVYVPPHVREQIQREFGSPEWLNKGQLSAAIRASAHDGRVFDDPHGADFWDMLELTHEEKSEQDRRGMSVYGKEVPVKGGFADRYLHEEQDGSGRIKTN